MSLNVIKVDNIMEVVYSVYLILLPCHKTPMSILFLILLLTTVEQCAIDIYLPSFPAMSHFFHVDDSKIQLSLSLYMMGFAFSSLFAGPLTDRYGRKIILNLGLIAFFASTLLCAISMHINLLLIGRILMGSACGLLVVANQAMVRDSYQGNKLIRVSSYMSMVWSIVPIVAPAIGGYIQRYSNWQGNFYFIAFYIFLSWLCVVFCAKETMKAAPKAINLKSILFKYYYLLKHREFLMYVACTALSFAITTAFITAAPFIFQDLLGYNPVEFGWLALLVAVSYLIGTYLNNMLIHRYSAHHLICTGLVCICVFSLLGLLFGLAGYVNVYVISIPVGIVIFAGGFIYPNAAALAFEPIHKNIGIASALYISLQLLVCALSSAVMAKLPEHNQVPMMAFLLLLSVALTAIYLYFKPKNIRAK